GPLHQDGVRAGRRIDLEVDRLHGAGLDARDADLIAHHQSIDVAEVSGEGVAPVCPTEEGEGAERARERRDEEETSRRRERSGHAARNCHGSFGACGENTKSNDRWSPEVGWVNIESHSSVTSSPLVDVTVS